MDFSELGGEVGTVNVHLSKSLQARYRGLIEEAHVLVPAGDDILYLWTGWGMPRFNLGD